MRITGCALLWLALSACDDDAGTAARDDAGPTEQPGGDGGGGSGDGGDGPGPQPGGSPLLSTDDLEARSFDMVVLDARSSSAFSQGQVAGAIGLDAASLRATVDGVAGQLPPADDVAAALSAAGVQPDLPIVVYGAQTDLAAARLLWTLEYMGEHSVQLLDGGFDLWEQQGRSIEAGERTARPSEYPSDRLEHERRVDADWVMEHLDDPDVVLIDARSAAEYETSHIPGARSFDWQNNVEQGRMKPLTELRAMYEEVSQTATIVAYCQTGSRAAMAYLTMRYLGYPDVRLYDGSMAEWTSDPARPLE